jgi:hypothetical protein
MDEKTYMDSYMADLKNNVSWSILQPLDENQEPSHFYDHRPWLMCEVALSYLAMNQ